MYHYSLARFKMKCYICCYSTKLKEATLLKTTTKVYFSSVQSSQSATHLHQEYLFGAGISYSITHPCIQKEAQNQRSGVLPQFLGVVRLTDPKLTKHSVQYLYRQLTHECFFIMFRLLYYCRKAFHCNRILFWVTVFIVCSLCNYSTVYHVLVWCEDKHL